VGKPKDREYAGGRLRLDHPADAVARITIDHPERRNAMDQEILDGIAAAVSHAGDARCLIVTGAGGMFSAGYDIGDLPEEVFAREAERLIAHPFAAAIEAVEKFPYPTLAAVGGHAIGGGLELALTCDLRIAADGARVGMPPSRLGLVYSHTGIQKFLNTVGAARTRELFLLGHTITTDTALAWGLVNWTTDPDDVEERSIELAAELAGNAPLALKGNKEVINSLLACDHALDPDTEQHLIELRRQCFHSADFREGVRAFAEKRPPRWTGT
jgi:enoyl-CoA hydratase/carnithine racemase